MKRNMQSITMDRQLYIVSSYKALMTAKYTLGILLLCYLLYAQITAFFTMQPLYFLTILFLLPPAVHVFLSDNLQKLKEKKISGISDKKNDTPFPMINRKYGYTRLKHQCNSIVFLFVCLLLLLWQETYSNSTFVFPHKWTYLTPSFLLMITISIRIFGILYYFIKIKYSLLHGKI